MKAYIAFSIHGTNTFLVATKNVESITDLGPEFKAVPSRRPGYSSDDGVKVEWKGLTVKKTKLPYKHPLWVLNAFNVLETQGWQINTASFNAFMSKHFQPKLRRAVAA